MPGGNERFLIVCARKMPSAGGPPLTLPERPAAPATKEAHAAWFEAWRKAKKDEAAARGCVRLGVYKATVVIQEREIIFRESLFQ